MTYPEFRKALSPFSVFSTQDIIKIFPDFDSRRLVEWQKKEYIRKIVNKWYAFSEKKISETLLYRISNCIYRPSYVSLESALAYHHLIPEGVYSQQAVTTRKTINYETPFGAFNYRTIKSKLFFGYQILHVKDYPVMMAGMEKAILDFLYLSSAVKTSEDIESHRLNYAVMQHSVNWEKMNTYLKVFANKTLNKKIAVLKKLIPHVNAS